MIYGMTPAQFEILDVLVVKPLKLAGADVFIFGSRATGKHHSHSDVDLLYQVPEGTALPPGFISNLSEAIEESKFPFAVELVADTDLAESYRPTVLAQKKRL